MNTNRLRKLQEGEAATGKCIRAGTLREQMAKVDEHSETHRAQGRSNGLFNIPKDYQDQPKRPGIEND